MVRVQHPLYREKERLARIALHLTLERRDLRAAGVAGMREIVLLLDLIARPFHLLDVRHDDEVSAIDGGREPGLMLTPEQIGYLTCEPARRFVLRVKGVPAALRLDGLYIGTKCLLRHRETG